IKMTGMPAFGPTHSEKELWGLAALTEQIPRMTPDQYEQALEQTSSGHEHQGHNHGGGQPQESQRQDAQESAEAHENGHQH
ncbi:MAG: cytochrome c, partial [Desulfobacteraceae bacterium]|nr:cytochrome c [Desulfobacteraceae bacterium]